MKRFSKVMALLLAALLALSAAGCSAAQLPASSTGTDTKAPAGPSAASSGAQAEPTPNPEAGFLDVSAYPGTVLEETADAGEKYIEETLFVGDSNTVRYYLYGAMPLSSNIGCSGMATGSITSFPCVQFYGYNNLVTMPKAIGIIQPRRVVFGFGSNNLTGDLQTAVKNYRNAVNTCLQEYPYFTVIISAVPALDVNRSSKSLKQSEVDGLNEMLADMCQEEGWYFLNSAEALKDPDTGWARSGYTISDGLHLSEDGVNAYLSYVRTHADPTQDQRPSVPKNVPDHTETPVDLLPKAEASESGSEDAAGESGSVKVQYSVQGNGTLQGETTQTVKKGDACGEVWVYAADGWALDHWEINLDGQSYSEQECLRLTIPEECRQSSVTATAYLVQTEDAAAEAPAEEDSAEEAPAE